MKNTTNHYPLSRRQWLGKLSIPVVGASLGAAVLDPSQSMGAALAPDPGHDLGARIYNIRDFGAVGDGVALDTAAL